MEITPVQSSGTGTDGSDSLIDPPISDHDVDTDLESLRRAHDELRSKYLDMEAELRLLRRQRDEAIDRNNRFIEINGELSLERGSLCGRISELEATLEEKEEKISKSSREKREIVRDLDVSKERIGELEAEKRQKSNILLNSIESIKSVKDYLLKAIELVNNKRHGGKNLIENDGDHDRTELELDEETMEVTKLAKLMESMINDYAEAKKKEKRELQSSVVSLTEENRDINSLLRIALVEKEALEKKLKVNTEQKRVALLQIAERGLQRVGFGFIMGSGSQELAIECSGTGSSRSDGSTESEEEIVSLASTVEKIMKNLRHEISQLRISLEESRSENKRLQSLLEQQNQKIGENRIYIEELEDRERVLAGNVDQLLTEISETEAEAARWREACELEVEAGKLEVAERDKLIIIFKQELERTKAALETLNGKLKLKEDLVKTAMVAHEASERSLQLADSRATRLRNCVEELTKQLEEAETKERNRRKARRICWPWQALKTARHVNSSRVQITRGLLQDTQAFL